LAGVWAENTESASTVDGELALRKSWQETMVRDARPAIRI
jgi:hypothetical protein